MINNNPHALPLSPLSQALACALGVTLSCVAPGALATSPPPDSNPPIIGYQDVLSMSWSGVFTLLFPNGAPLNNSDNYLDESIYYGWRTPVSGTFQFNTTTGAGSGTVVPFSFASGGLAQATSISLQAIGDGMGGPGTLVLGNMGFSWDGTNGIPISIVWDAAGLLGCLSDGYTVSEACAGVGALAATENTKVAFYRTSYILPLGPAPIATTTWNTTTIGGASCSVGCNPSGTLPIIADTVVDASSHPAGDIGIGGSPMVAGPFPAFNANFDVLSLHITGIDYVPIYGTSAVPVPAAVWLFGSGLLGVLGLARRRRR